MDIRVCFLTRMDMIIVLHIHQYTTLADNGLILTKRLLKYLLHEPSNAATLTVFIPSILPSSAQSQAPAGLSIALISSSLGNFSLAQASQPISRIVVLA